MSLAPAGIALLATSAAAYGIVPVLARLYYEGGGTPVMLLGFRYVASAALVAVMLPLLGRPWHAGRDGLIVGGLLAIISYGYLAAVKYIPVSIAALVFFTYPMLTVLTARLLRLETIGWRKGVGVVVAFAGLALGLRVETDGALDWRGVALTGLAAITYTALLLVSGRAARAGGGLEITFQANLVAAIVFAPLAAVLGEVAFPATTLGWVGLLGVTASYFLGIVTFVAGIGRIGAVRAAAVANIEPLVSFAGAVAILGEFLSMTQVLGIAMVGIGIFAMSR